MNSLDKIKDLLDAPSFTTKEAKALGVTHNALEWYVKHGLIIKLSRGVYCHPTNQLANIDYKHEELIRIISSLPFGVVCLITAMDLYGITNEFVRSYSIAIPHDTYAKKIPNVTFYRFRDMDTGLSTIKLGSHAFPIFDKERTIIDAFRLLPKETAIKSIKMAWESNEKFDLRKISLYAQKLRFDITPYLLSITTG